MASHQQAPHQDAEFSSDSQGSALPAGLSTTPSSSDTPKSSISTVPGVHQVADPTATSTTMPPHHYHGFALPSPQIQSQAIPPVAGSSQATQTSFLPLPAPPGPSHPPSPYSIPQFAPSPSYNSSTYIPPMSQWPSLNPANYTIWGPSSDGSPLPSPSGQPSYPLSHSSPLPTPSGQTSYPSSHGSETSLASTADAPVEFSHSLGSGHPAFTAGSAFSLSPVNGPPHPQPSSLPPASNQTLPLSSPSNPPPGYIDYFNGLATTPNPDILHFHATAYFGLPFSVDPSEADMTSVAPPSHTMIPEIHRFPPRRLHSLADVLRFIDGLPEVKMEELDDQHRTCGICWGDYVNSPTRRPISPPPFSARMRLTPI